MSRDIWVRCVVYQTGLSISLRFGALKSANDKRVIDAQLKLAIICPDDHGVDSIIIFVLWWLEEELDPRPQREHRCIFPM